MTNVVIYNPPSASNSFVNHLVFIGAMAFSVMLVLKFPDFIREYPVLFIAFYAVPIGIYEVVDRKVFVRTTSGLQTGFANSFSLSRILLKYLGLSFTLGIIAALYWLFPEYGKEMYYPFFAFTKHYFAWIIGVSLAYMLVIDRLMKVPKDIYYQVGRFMTGRGKPDAGLLANHARSWAVRAFFLPPMFGYLMGDLNYVLNFDLFAPNDFKGWFDFSYNWIIIADLVAVVTGYAIAARFLDNHIQSTDKTVKGWFVCLMCYPPIWSLLFYASYFTYANRPDWYQWFQDFTLIKYIWAGLIMIFMGLYASASLSFGLRWSNLTYRGLISDGTYRLTKHPAYVFKNVSWWLMSMPFMLAPGTTWLQSVRDCIMLLGINYIYYLRARTEETHLSRYPEYEEYARWIEDHGILRWFGRKFSCFRYRSQNMLQSEYHV